MTHRTNIDRGLRVALSIVAGILTGCIVLAVNSDAQASSFNVLHTFCSKRDCKDGRDPVDKLLVDSSGTIYGTTSGGGDYNGGTVFKLSFDAVSSSWRHRVVHSFCAMANCRDGEAPFGGLIQDAAGNLYGMAFGGGLFVDAGVAFELLPNAKKTKWKYKILYEFCGVAACADGKKPVGELTYAGEASGGVYDGVSPLFGVVESGGLENNGAAFSLSPGSRKHREQVIYSFCSTGGSGCTDGALPLSGMAADATGNLYGTAFQGGAAGYGVAYELTPKRKKWNYALLHSFGSLTGNADGAGPIGKLFRDNAGNLFGTAVNGGNSANCCGVIFKLSFDGSQWNSTVIYDFCSLANCPDGIGPESGVISDNAGDLFGTTFSGGGESGGGERGVAFNFDGSNLEVLHGFCEQSCNDGMNPEAGLFRDATGNLFGTTTFGGLFGVGVVFMLTP